jgi:hypothetical protein
MRVARIFALIATFCISASLASANGNSLSGKYERVVNGKPDTNTATITLEEKSGGKVHVSGDAVWVGNPATGNVNTGEIAGDFSVVNNQILYRDASTGCRMTIAIVKDGLKVSKTTAACGGLNVTFDGSYRKVAQ